MCPEWVKSGEMPMLVTRRTVVKVESWVSKNCPAVGVLVSILPRMAEAVWEGEVGIGEWDVEREERRSVEVVAVAVRCAMR